MRRLAAVAACALLGTPAWAQLDIGRLIDYGRKAVDAGSKLQEANKDFTQDQEIQLGEGITAGLLGAAPLSTDANLQRYVNRVGRWVALHSDRPDLPWTFGVIETRTVNAFAMPGGTILVSKGLVDRLGSESELAGALAHEIAHVVKRHQLAAIQSSLNSDVLSSIGKDVASEAINRRGGDAFGLKSQLAGVGIDALKNGVFLRPLDRSMEYEADRMGVIIATRAGYDPYGLPGVLELLGTVHGDGSGISIMETHPAPSDRLAELEKVMPAVDGYANQPRLEGRFLQVVGRAK
ncbi:MAG TPA: M48 family metalloprotease [Usitatibacter sp.]|jgi:predicted Zn-dependent protease|nr:M48 family metalloprotease [Usitatibacter sp.]